MKQSRYNIWVGRDDGTYVFNGISGALLRAPDAGQEALERFLAGDDQSGCTPKFLEQLAIGRMLVADDADELAMLEMRYQLSRYDTSTFGLTLVTSLGCNFDCPYCFEAKHPSIMDAAVVEGILGLVDEQLPKINALTVTWFGGEPLVGKVPLLALSDAFIARCDEAGVVYTAAMTTNGYLLDEPMCIELAKRRLASTQVCLDGPPEIHDKMRPLVNGKGTFWRIVRNLQHAVDYLNINVRINVDTTNFGHAEELLEILAAEGLAGKMRVNLGHIVGVDDGAPSPSSTYTAKCFTGREFALAELEFAKIADRHGFGGAGLARPTGTPCTAVRANELVVGSKGELYKCWESVGNAKEEIGTIWDFSEENGRRRRWMNYDPFADRECQGCIALPVCMGGCAHHGMDLLQRENRCDTFRHTYTEQVDNYIAAATAGEAVAVPVGLSRAMDRR